MLLKRRALAGVVNCMACFITAHVNAAITLNYLSDCCNNFIEFRALVIEMNSIPCLFDPFSKSRCLAFNKWHKLTTIVEPCNLNTNRINIYLIIDKQNSNKANIHHYFPGPLKEVMRHTLVQWLAIHRSLRSALLPMRKRVKESSVWLRHEHRINTFV